MLGTCTSHAVHAQPSLQQALKDVCLWLHLQTHALDSRSCVQIVNSQLGLEGHTWEPTKESFRKFVLALHARGLKGINEYFAAQGLVCGETVTYEYALPIEDIAQWFPCFEAGLRLWDFTARGWKHHNDGQVWVGAHLDRDEQLKSTECWWRPKHMSTCKEYYSATHPEWHGDWENIDNSAAVPLDAERNHQPVSTQRDSAHETGAAREWARLYTQELGEMVYQLYKADFDAFGYERQLFSVPEVAPTNDGGTDQEHATKKQY
jgi:hypothetical protein